MDLQKEEKRFLIIGLDYECHVFGSVDMLWKHIADCFAKRKERDESQQSEFMWVDVQQPAPDDMQLLAKHFHLHPLTTEDCISGDSSDKWEVFDSYMFVVFSGQVDTDDAEADDTTKLNVILYHNYVLTIHDKPIKGLNLLLQRIAAEHELPVGIQSSSDLYFSSLPKHKYDTARAKAKEEIPTTTTTTTAENTQLHLVKRTELPSADWILYAYFDAMVDLYMPIVESLVDEVEALDDLILVLSEQEGADLLARIGSSMAQLYMLTR